MATPVKEAAKQSIVAYKSSQIIYMGSSQVRQWDELSPNQLKLAMMSAAKVGPNDNAETQYTLTFKEFFNLCRFEETGGKDYERVFREARRLSKLGVDFTTPDGELVGFNWINSVRVSPKSGTLKYRLDESLLPFYKTKKGSFALINIADYMRLRSRYSLLLYEFLAKWQRKRMVYLDVESLRNQLRVPNGKYRRPYDLGKQVVDRAVAEINKKAEYAFRVRTEERRGKRGIIEGVTFYIDAIASADKLEPDEKDLVNQLISLGVENATAQSLVRTYGRKRIKDNIEVARKRISTGKVENVPGLICVSIAEDFAGVDQTSLAFEEMAATITEPLSATRRAKPDCPKCGGTGRIRYEIGDTQEKVVVVCDCWKS